MKIAFNKYHPLQFTKKNLKINPWLLVTISLFLILPSLYTILDDITILRREHFVLFIGFLLFAKSLLEIFDRILEIPEEI
jgi:hypothetical protein